MSTPFDSGSLRLSRVTIHWYTDVVDCTTVARTTHLHSQTKDLHVCRHMVRRTGTPRRRILETGTRSKTT